MASNADKESIYLSKYSVVGNVKQEVNEYDLTPKQMQALMVALTQGYYTWPRKMNLNELAAVSGIKRRTIQENLRRAEAKIFRRLRGEFLQQEMMTSEHN